MLSHQRTGGQGRKKPSSGKRDWSHRSSAVVVAKERYSDSVLERDTVGCLRELHKIRLEPRKTQ